MKIKLIHKINSTINSDLINIIVESNDNNKQVKELLDYINIYTNEIVVKYNNELVKIPYKDIRFFYSKDKDTYCKTKDKEYKVKSKLYEVEKLNKDFIRISKKCVVNFNHAKCFDIGRIGKIVIKLDNNDIVTVSRRRIKDVMEYLDERSI